MAIGQVLAELWPAITQQQGQKVVQAFIAAQGPVPEGMTNGQFVEHRLRKYIRAVVFQADRKAKEVEIEALNAQNSQDFPE